MQGFSLDQMVGGVLAETRASMQKHAAAEASEPVATDGGYADEKTLAEEGVKLASALDFIADRLDVGDFDPDDAPETSLEQVKQAYEIVSQIEADPKLKLKIAAAVGQLPRSPGTGKGIIPGKAPSTALANDAGSRPGGGGQQVYPQAKAPGEFQIPRSPSAAKSVAPGHAPDAMLTDAESVPGGGGSYPEDGVIRTKSAASKVAAWGSIMKTAGEFSHDPAKDQGGKSAKISGAKSQGPLGKPKGAHAWGEGPGSTKPSEVMSSAAATKYTKAQAKEHVKADLAKVLSHPAFSKKHDDVTTQNLGASVVSKLASEAPLSKEAGALGAGMGAVGGGMTGTLAGMAPSFAQAISDARSGDMKKLKGSSERFKMEALGPAVRGHHLGAATGAALGAGKGRRTGAALGALGGSMAGSTLAAGVGGMAGARIQERLTKHLRDSKESTKEAGLRSWPPAPLSKEAGDDPKLTMGERFGTTGYGARRKKSKLMRALTHPITQGVAGAALGHDLVSTEGGGGKAKALGAGVGGALQGGIAHLTNRRGDKQWAAKQKAHAEKLHGAKYASADPAMQKLAGLANSELLDRVLRGEIDPSALEKLASTMSGGDATSTVDASSGMTLSPSGDGPTASDDKAVAFREALEESARHKGEASRIPSDVVGMPGNDTSSDSTTPSIPSY